MAERALRADDDYPPKRPPLSRERCESRRNVVVRGPNVIERDELEDARKCRGNGSKSDRRKSGSHSPFMHANKRADRGGIDISYAGEIDDDVGGSVALAQLGFKLWRGINIVIRRQYDDARSFNQQLGPSGWLFYHAGGGSTIFEDEVQYIGPRLFLASRGKSA